MRLAIRLCMCLLQPGQRLQTVLLDLTCLQHWQKDDICGNLVNLIVARVCKLLFLSSDLRYQISVGCLVRSKPPASPFDALKHHPCNWVCVLSHAD